MVNTILIVEDDKSLQTYLKELFLDNRYSAQAVSDGVAAIKAIQKLHLDLIILDLGLPNMTGEGVCMEIRKKFPDLPVIILTGKDTVEEKVHALDLGADDYITKPFVVDELLARVKARLRIHKGIQEKLKVANLELDDKTLEVKRDGKLITLTSKEFKLLEYLMSNKGRILTREMILNRIWLYSPDVETRVIDVYMGYLRKKVDNGFDKKLIHSIRGFGYMIKE